MPNGLLLPFTHTSFVRVFPSPLGSVWMWPIPKPPKLHVSIVSIINLLSPDWISRFYYSCYWCLSTAASTRLFISSLKATIKSRKRQQFKLQVRHLLLQQLSKYHCLSHLNECLSSPNGYSNPIALVIPALTRYAAFFVTSLRH